MPASNRIGKMIAGLAFVVHLIGMPVGAADEWDDTPSMPLCDALATSTVGNVTAVILRGVIVRGPEMVFLYDPAQRRCPLDVQPWTLVEIAADRPDLQALTRFLRDHGRATVTVGGRIHGPQTIGDDDLSLPTILAYSKRIAHLRYGHRGAFRTKFVVETVLDLSSAPEHGTNPFIVDEPSERDDRLPKLERLAVPRYPERARKAGLTDDVRVAVRIENGAVAAIRVMQGDRLFHAATIESVQSWVYSDALTAELDVTFSYRLELRPSDSDLGVRVELSLPSKVTIVAPSYGW